MPSRGPKVSMDIDTEQKESAQLPPFRMADVATTMQQLAEDDLREDEPIEDVESDEDVEESDGKFVRYNRAFIAKMSLAADNLKAYYNILKNCILSYKSVKSRLSWCFDSFNCGRHRLIKINVRGNGLIVYLALDPSHYEGTKYRFRDVGYKKKFEYVPMQIKVKSKRGLRYAIELTADVMARFGIAAGVTGRVAYAPERESVEMLMQRNLMRVVNQGAEVDEDAEPLTAEREPIAEVVVVEQEAAAALEAAADVAEEAPQEAPIVDAVLADAAISDKDAMAQVSVESARRTKGNKRVMVNIDVISRAFQAGDVVTLETLIAKRLVPASAGYLKVCARGALDKPLTVKANDFSVIAVKMIVLTGGHAVRIKV